MTQPTLRGAACASIFLAIGFQAAFAQAAPVGDPAASAATPVVTVFTQTAKDKNLFSYDFGIPTSPALTLIGTSTDKSSPSASLKPFVLSLPASWGGAKDSQSFGVDFSPEWILNANPVDYQTYMDSPWLQLAYRSRLEGALFLGDDGGGVTAKAKNSRLAFGASISLLKDSDPVTATTTDGKTSVWKDCVAGVQNSPDAVLYTNDYAALARNYIDFSKTVGAPVEKASAELSLPHVTTPPSFTAALAAVTDCLKADGICKSHDTNGDLQAVLNKAESPEDKIKDIVTALKNVELGIQNDLKTESKTAATKHNILSALGTCTTKANAAARLGADLDIGGGVVWSGTPGKAEGFKSASGALWIAGKLPLGVFNPTITGAADADPSAQSVMLGGSLRASWSETVSTGNTATPSIQANVIDAWLGLERYTAGTKFAAEAGYNDTSATAAAQSAFSKSGFRWQVSGSVKLSGVWNGLLQGAFFASDSPQSPNNGIWVNASYGSSSGTVTSLNDKTFMVSLSFSPTDPYNLFGEVGK
ncbi:MAG: hypothetical protein WCA78_02995 [Rhizomicrobium sp.]